MLFKLVKHFFTKNMRSTFNINVIRTFNITFLYNTEIIERFVCINKILHYCQTCEIDPDSDIKINYTSTITKTKTLLFFLPKQEL